MLNKTITELVREKPSRSKVFEKFGIDYCCGGKKTLLDSCQAKEIDPKVVIEEITKLDLDKKNMDEDALLNMNTLELVNYLQTKHHAYLNEAMPRVQKLVEKVVRAHGNGHPELFDVAQVYEKFYHEMQDHLAKEDNIVFPHFIHVMKSNISSDPSVKMQLQVLFSDHDETGNDLKQIRKLTKDFTIPQNACGTYRAMLDGLAEIEKDTLQHLHIENNILFSIMQKNDA